jgi:hypothetical protein
MPGDYDQVTPKHKAEGFGVGSIKDTIVAPFDFNKENKAMIDHCKMILLHGPRKISIN